MTSATASSITIERHYFDALVRRAQFNIDACDGNGPAAPVHSVSLPRPEYDRLMSIVAKYDNLRRHLLQGGVGEETIDFLSKDDPPAQATTATIDPYSHFQPTNLQANNPSSAFYSALGRQLPAGHTEPQRGLAEVPDGFRAYNNNGAGTSGSKFLHGPSPPWADADGTDDTSCDGEETPLEGPPGTHYYHNSSHNNAAHQPAAPRPQFERQCNRTLQLTNLAEGTTHADITGAVRGGMLLDIFLRTHERSATVSFLNAVSARGFFDHVRKHDLYIKNKRVDVKWNDRQFILPGHVANKIGMGASRNLVIRKCDARHTEDTIREDLDHIHNLMVVKIEFLGGDCHIHLNSVHNAIYARTCMMSRFRYKGSKIEWDLDECAQAYDRHPAAAVFRKNPHTSQQQQQVRKGAVAASANRFQLLHFDDDDDEEDEISAAFQSKKPVGIAA